MTVLSASDYETHCIEVLREGGYRITAPRIATIKCLAESKCPLSASGLYEKLSDGDCSPVDRVSVYRSLDTLLKLELVHRVSPEGSYLACVHRHCGSEHHVMSRCTSCKSVKELHVPGEVVAPLLFHMKTALSFEPDSHLLHLDGVCESCSSK